MRKAELLNTYDKLNDLLFKISANTEAKQFDLAYALGAKHAISFALGHSTSILELATPECMRKEK